MPYDGVKSLGAGVFISSISKSITHTVKDANKVKCEGCDDGEDASMRCIECGQNLGARCVLSHGKLRMSAAHQLIPIHEALKGKAEVMRIPRCQKHPALEINTYCKTCHDSVCPQCGVETHSGHIFQPLGEVVGYLEKEIAGFTVVMKKMEEEARGAVKTLGNSLKQIEKQHPGFEKDIREAFDEIHAAADARCEELLGHVNQGKKATEQEREQAEYAAAEFGGFCVFTEGLLIQGTPLEIAGSFGEVGRLLWFCFLISDSMVSFFLSFLR